MVKQVIQDLLDTLRANQDRCVGMADSIYVITDIVIYEPSCLRYNDFNIKIVGGLRY